MRNLDLDTDYYSQGSHNCMFSQDIFYCPTLDSFMSYQIIIFSMCVFKSHEENKEETILHSFSHAEGNDAF